jgi:hypothetical protein
MVQRAVWQLVKGVADGVGEERRAVVALADGEADAVPRLAQAELERLCVLGAWMTHMCACVNH